MDSRNRPWSRTTWDRQINFPGPSQLGKKPLPDGRICEGKKNGCISPMAIRHNVGMASTSRQKVIKKPAMIICTEMKGGRAGTLVRL